MTTLMTGDHASRSWLTCMTRVSYPLAIQTLARAHVHIPKASRRNCFKIPHCIHSGSVMWALLMRMGCVYGSSNKNLQKLFKLASGVFLKKVNAVM